ncbi:hypothetical protein E4U24_002990 [Claviceps purpurea]|nr:hypothetical protein E4U24_002990 [Claviceps purpurea]
MDFHASSLSAIEADLNRLRAELASFLNNYSATKPAGSRLPVYQPRFGPVLTKWIFVYDGLADQIQKQLPYYFESGAALDWSTVAFLNHLEVLYYDSTSVRLRDSSSGGYARRRASDESFSDYLVRFEAQMARAHRLDAPEDEKVEFLHRLVCSKLDELCRHRTIPTHGFAEAVAIFKHQKAEHRALELRNLIRMMTNTTAVARTGFSGNSRKSKPGGRKGVKTTVFSKDPSESRRSPDQRPHRSPHRVSSSSNSLEIEWCNNSTFSSSGASNL